MAAGNNRTVLTALLTNAGIAVAKLIGFMVTGSSSMLSEAVHSFADATSQLLLLFGGQQTRRKATYDQPFGYGRERYFWSFVVAIILFSLGALFSLFEGKNKIDSPTELTSPGVALVILVVAIGLQGFAFVNARTAAERMKGRTSWTAFVRRSKNPEIPIVLIENAGALIGLSIAFVGILLAAFFNPVFDGVATMLIGVVMLVLAIVLAIEMKSLLIGESASPENRDRLIASIEGHRDVVRLIDMRTQHLGPDQLLVGAKVHYRETLTTAELAEAINQTELDMRSAVNERLTIYVEPDLFDDADSDDPSLTDPFANLPASPPSEEDEEFEESVVDRSSHDDRNSGDDRDRRRDQPESYAGAFGMAAVEQAIVTPPSGGDSAIDLAIVDEATRPRSESVVPNVTTSLPLAHADTSTDNDDESQNAKGSLRIPLSSTPSPSDDSDASSDGEPAPSERRDESTDDNPENRTPSSNAGETDTNDQTDTQSSDDDETTSSSTTEAESPDVADSDGNGETETKSSSTRSKKSRRKKK